jgi:osmotically-inducible protein OsmY
MWFALSAATAGLLLLGTGSRAVADDSSAAAQATADTNAQEEQEIRTQFDKTSDLKNKHIDVKVDDGIAVLEGTVDSQREKKEAQQLAHVDGVLGVNNRLQIHAQK